MKSRHRKNCLSFVSILCGLSIASSNSHAQSKLYGITGQQTDDTPAAGGGVQFSEHTLFEMHTATAALANPFMLTWINDSQSIGFNPDNQLIYHTGGSEAYSNNPGRLGHDQGGPDIAGGGYQT